MPILLVLQEASEEALGSVLDTMLTLGGVLSHTETWLWLTLVLLIIEIFTAGFFIGALAAATLVSAGAAWLGASTNWQVVIFALAAIASLIWIRPVFLKLLSTSPVETNAPSLVGQPGTVTDQVPADGHGRVRLANEEWRATSSANLSVGDAVRVLEVRGNTLVVGKA
ncbi:MAG: NfeD family protein [Planctomycetota bacterium]|jgi:membrane protein implicated in regulation of membrane protease activity